MIRSCPTLASRKMFAMFSFLTGGSPCFWLLILPGTCTSALLQACHLQTNPAWPVVSLQQPCLGFYFSVCFSSCRDFCNGLAVPLRLCPLAEQGCDSPTPTHVLALGLIEQRDHDRTGHGSRGGSAVLSTKPPVSGRCRLGTAQPHPLLSLPRLPRQCCN